MISARGRTRGPLLSKRGGPEEVVFFFSRSRRRRRRRRHHLQPEKKNILSSAKQGAKMMTPKTALLLLAALALVAPVARAALLSGDAAAQALAAAAAAAASSAASRPSSSAAGAGGVSTSGDAAIASLMRTLRLDPDARYSPEADKVFYTCSGLRGGGGHGHAHADAAALDFNASSTSLLAPAPAGGANGLVWPNEADPSTANAFKLHSRPGAPKKIVLDFTGHRLRAGTIWFNSIVEGDVPLTLPPYDIDGNPSSFSKTELANIVSTWRMVAEDFAPWNVDVTTEEPKGTDDEADASLSGVGVRAIVTGYNAWDKFPAGGSAYLSTFGEFIAGPVLMAHNIGTPKQMAVTISHEVGHTVGLNHHGSFAEPADSVFRAYYKGHGSWGEEKKRKKKKEKLLLMLRLLCGACLGKKKRRATHRSKTTKKLSVRPRPLPPLPRATRKKQKQQNKNQRP
jgi:hypothetical protein